MTGFPHWEVCYIHNASEVQTVDTFKVCGECWHVWQTEGEFWADVDAIHAELGWPLPNRNQPIHVCPLCSHDF